MQMCCEFEKYIPLLYEVVQFAYIKEPLSYEYINTDSSYSALWAWLLAAFWFKCLKKSIFVTFYFKLLHGALVVVKIFTQEVEWVV